MWLGIGTANDTVLFSTREVGTGKVPFTGTASDIGAVNTCALPTV